MSGRETGMAEEGGDLVDIVTSLLAEHGSCVTKGVNTDLGWIQAGAPGIFLEKAPDFP